VKLTPKVRPYRPCEPTRRLQSKPSISSRKAVLTALPLCLLLVLPLKVNADDWNERSTQPLLTITAPQQSARLDGNSITITLQISRNAKEHSLAVRLNGTPIAKEFQPSGKCRSAICSRSATVNAEDGLRPGANVLRASIEGDNGRHDRDKIRFKWQTNGGVGATPAPEPFQLTSAIGFTTLAPGGQASGSPWIQLASNALHGGTVSYPTPSQATCTTTYQVLVLNRQTLGETSYNCYDSDTNLTTALAQLSSSDLVIAGTTLGHNAGSAMNTTSIGGTSYLKVPAAQYPQGYMAIGVGGATSGATESYYLTAWLNDDQDSGSYLPQMSGILSTDSVDNFNYHPTNNTTFSVVNTPGSGGPYQISVNDTVGNVTYTPPASSANGFWLLALKRTKLGNLFSCDTNVTPTPCGAFYPTGNSNSSIAQVYALALASALNGVSSEQLLFLVSIGTPFNGAPPSQLSAAVENLGGAGQSLLTISQNGEKYNYTLITSTDPSFTKSYPGGEAVVSSNLNVNQGQTGSVYGVLSRGLNNLYVTASVNQGNVLTDTVVADQSLYQLAWKQPQPWPLMDTPARQGAYRYLSYIVAKTVLPSGAAPVDDVRSQYTSSNNTAIVTGKPILVPYPNGGTWTDNVPGSPDQGTVYTFLPNDMNAVAAQLSAEFSDLSAVGSYMLGSTTNVGLKPSLVAGNNAAVLTMLGAAATAGSQLSAPTSASTKLNPAAMSNILRATMSLLSVVSPEIAPLLVVAGATLWLSTASSPLDKTSTGIPSPFNDVTTTLANLANADYLSLYTENTGDAFDQMLDNIDSDWYKLSTAATNSATVWKVQQQSDWDSVTQALAESARVQFYSAIFASVYSIDVFPAQPISVSQPSDIGSTKAPNQPCGIRCRNICDGLYSSLPSNGWVKHGLGPSYDFLIVGGPLKDNNTNSMSEKLPSSSYLDTLFGSSISSGDLNLITDQFFASNSILSQRTGTAAPGYSAQGLCYAFGPIAP
jgi:hypothetical protein